MADDILPPGHVTLCEGLPCSALTDRDDHTHSSAPPLQRKISSQGDIKATDFIPLQPQLMARKSLEYDFMETEECSDFSSFSIDAPARLSMSADNFVPALAVVSSALPLNNIFNSDPLNVNLAERSNYSIQSSQIFSSPPPSTGFEVPPLPSTSSNFFSGAVPLLHKEGRAPPPTSHSPWFQAPPFFGATAGSVNFGVSPPSSDSFRATHPILGFRAAALPPPSIGLGIPHPHPPRVSFGDPPPPAGFKASALCNVAFEAPPPPPPPPRVHFRETPPPAGFRCSARRSVAFGAPPPPSVGSGAPALSVGFGAPPPSSGVFGASASSSSIGFRAPASHVVEDAPSGFFFKTRYQRTEVVGKFYHITG